MAGIESLIPNVNLLATKTELKPEEIGFLVDLIRVGCGQKTPDDLVVGSLNPHVARTIKEVYVGHFEPLTGQVDPLDEQLAYADLGIWMQDPQAMTALRDTFYRSR